MKHGYMLLTLLLTTLAPTFAHAAPPASTPRAASLGKPDAIGTPATTTTRTPKAKLADGEQIDVNKATLTDLEKLPNIGPVTAQAILNWREANGAFKAPEDLMKVPGIRAKRFAKIQPYVVVQQQ